MALVGLVVLLCAIALLLVSVPVAIAVVIGVAQWMWSSGFLVCLGICAVVLPLLVWLDPRERRHRRSK